MTDQRFIIVEVLFPGLTQLDFTGPHTVLSRLPGVDVIVASEPGGPIESDGGLTFAGTRRLAEIERCDLLFLPGGMAATDVINDEAFMDQIRRLSLGARYLTSVCTGSLILGAYALWRKPGIFRSDGTWAPGLVVGLLFAFEFVLLFIAVKLTTAASAIV